MISTLRGNVTEKLDGALVLEVGGVGYELAVTTDNWGGARLGAESRFYIYEQIREDAFTLFGFAELSSKQLFVQLLSVKGVGPKVALAVLSAAGESRLRQAVAAGDPALLRGVSGVGARTAERIVIELRGKVAEGVAGLAPVADPTYQALVALGYSPAQATTAVAALPADISGEQARLKAALKGSGK